MGQPKALVRLDADTMVVRSTRVLVEAGCDRVGIVVGAAGDDVEAEVHRAVADNTLPAGVAVLVNPDWASGMASSFRLGLLWASTLGADAVAVHLVDLPDVQASTFRRLLGARDRDDVGMAAWVATYDGLLRNPVVFDTSAIAAVIESLPGDQANSDAGARAWLRANPGIVSAVACDDIATDRDLDTPDQVDQWLARPSPSTLR